MYSGYHDRSDRQIRLPENYNGCAFGSRRETLAPRPTEEIRRVEIGKPSLRATETQALGERRDEAERDAIPTYEEEVSPDVPKTETRNPAALPAIRSFPIGGRGFPFAHGIGFDEILLLGLIVLLAGCEESGEIVLWLALLLFCG